MKFKTIIFIFITLLFISCKDSGNSYFKKNQNTIDYFMEGMRFERLKELKGKVRVLSVFEYTLNEDSSIDDMIIGSPTFSFVFDNDKRVIEAWDYYGTKQVISKTFYRDYRKGTIDSTFSYTENGTFKSKYLYDDNDFLIGSEQINETGLLDSMKSVNYTIWQKGDTLIHCNVRSTDKYLNNLLLEEVYNNRCIIRKYDYFPNKSLKSITHYDNGKIEFIEEFNTEGYPVFIQRFNIIEGIYMDKLIYNKDKLILKKIITSKFNTGRTFEDINDYSYKNGKLISIVFNNTDTVLSYKYNKKGECIEKTDSAKNTESYEYLEYDSHGNWIKKKVFHNHRPAKLIEREIEYY